MFRNNKVDKHWLENQTMVDLIGKKKTSSLTQWAKMILVMGLLIMALLMLTGVLLYMSISTARTVNDASRNIQLTIEISDLVTELQVERGLTAMYLSVNGTTNIGDVPEIHEARGNTDKEMGDIHLDGRIEYMITMLRNEVNAGKYNLKEMIKKYSSLDNFILDSFVSDVDLPAKGIVWKSHVSLNAIIRALDGAQIKRALGSTFFITCGLDQETHQWFLQKGTELDVYLEQTFFYYHKGKAFYDQRVNSTDEVKGNLSNMIETLDAGFITHCQGMTAEEKSKESFIWFNSMTKYLGILRQIKDMIVSDRVKTLARLRADANRDVAVYTTVTVIVTLASLMIGLVYARYMNEMTEKIKNYANKVLLHCTTF